MKKIALFASGSGTNVENIANFFKDHPTIEVSLVLTNNPKAYVIQRANNLNIPSVVFTRDEFNDATSIVDILEKNEIDFVVLAGFLWLVPQHLIQRYPNKIINIHPALLPNYGGKGMFGDRVHEAVIANKESQSGITIHYVNAAYDEGAIISQATTPIEPNDTPDSLAQKIHALEYKYYPEVIEKVLTSN